MFFEFDSNLFLEDMAYLEKNDDLLNPEEGLTLGNLFLELYRPYKHYKPQKLIARNEEEELLLKIQELSFAINDLGLCLDLNPRNQKLHHFYKQYIVELKRVTTIYVSKYGPLAVEDDLKGEYEWVKGPWPWEGYHV